MIFLYFSVIHFFFHSKHINWMCWGKVDFSVYDPACILWRTRLMFMRYEYSGCFFSFGRWYDMLYRELFVAWTCQQCDENTVDLHVITSNIDVSLSSAIIRVVFANMFYQVSFTFFDNENSVFFGHVVNEQVLGKIDNKLVTSFF